MKLLLYCTKAKPTLYNVLGKYVTCDYMGDDFMQDGKMHPELNGKIVAECDYEVEEITIGRSYGFNPNMCIISTKNLQPIELLSKSCYGDYDDLFKYLKYDFDSDYGNHKGPYGYAIHIRNLHIFDEPRELSFYYQKYKNDKHLYNIEKAPQNMMKAIGKQGDDYILISIRPEWLCKILNKEKTIEVRRKILKEMDLEMKLLSSLKTDEPRIVTVCGTGPVSKKEEELVKEKLKSIKEMWK